MGNPIGTTCGRNLLLVRKSKTANWRIEKSWNENRGTSNLLFVDSNILNEERKDLILVWREFKIYDIKLKPAMN